MKSQVVAELRRTFSDLLNYDANDPLEPIDPLTYRSPEGDTCLHIAALRGDLRSVQLLLEAGLDVNDLGDMGNTPLHYARKRGHEEVVQLLLRQGANPNIRNEFGEKAADGNLTE